jgi:hypothetical protein
VGQGDFGGDATVDGSSSRRALTGFDKAFAASARAAPDASSLVLAPSLPSAS